jgi:hypothetical protein
LDFSFGRLPWLDPHITPIFKIYYLQNYIYYNLKHKLCNKNLKIRTIVSRFIE